MQYAGFLCLTVEIGAEGKYDYPFYYRTNSGEIHLLYYGI